MKFAELEQHIFNAKNQINNEKFASFYIVTGDDAYLKSMANKLFRSVVDQEFVDFNFSVQPLNFSMSDVVDALYTFPMFDERKIVVVPDASDNLADADKIMLDRYLDDPTPSSILVAHCNGDALKLYLKRASVQFVDCSRLDDKSIAIEVNKILETAPRRTIDNNALSELIRRTLGSMSKISCELQKLKAYADDNITIGDIKELVVPELDFQIFELSSAVSEKNPDKALTVLDSFFKNGIKPMTVISLLYGHYRKMLHAELHKNETDEVVAKLLGVKTAALYHTRRVSKNYSQIRLKNCVDLLHNLQYDIVSGRRQEVSALHEAVLQLLAI